MHRQVLELRENYQAENHPEQRDTETPHQQRAAVEAANIYEIQRRQHQRGFAAGALRLLRLPFDGSRDLSDRQLLSL